MAIAVITTTLVAGLFSVRPPASQAAGRQPASRFAVAARVPVSAGTGVITGVVRSMTGRPLAAACVSAAGPAGSASAETKADGRYLLSGLRPGRYALRVLPCSTAMRADGRPVASLWPGMPGTVAVRADQVTTVAPAMIVQPGRPGLAPAGGRARTKTGSISGLVTGGGRRLGGICAEAFPVNGGIIGQAMTSKSGRYRISHLPPGPYQVEFAGQFDCQIGNVNWLAQWYPEINSPFQSGTVLHVRAGKPITGIDGKLNLGGEIAGVVRAKSGKKLADICVTAVESLPKLRGTIVDGFNTARRGAFVLHGLFPGRYTFLFTIGCGNSGNYAFQWWRGSIRESGATVIRVSGHKIVKNVDPVLVPGAAITGVVKGRSAAGPQLSGVCVSANDQAGAEAEAVTGEGGHYKLEGLAAEPYGVVFDPTCGQPPSPINYVARDRPITVKVGQTVSGFNAYLRPGAILSGKVTDTRGRPLRNVCVQVNDPNGDLVATRADGTYGVIGIPPGSHSVGFFGGCGHRGSLAPQFYNDQPDQRAAARVRFNRGKTTANIDAIMKPGGTIAGVVTDAAGHRLGGICVIAEAPSRFGEGSRGLASFADTGGRGHYLMTNLAPGPYLIQFNSGCTSRYASPWFSNQPDSTTADVLSVDPGVTTKANAKLGLAGRIAGTVTNSTGQRVSRECVSVFNAKNQAAVILPLGAAITGPRGRYLIGGLSPGRYLIQFSQCTASPRYGSRWFRNRDREISATSVTVKAGRTTSGINAAVAVGGSIAGIVTGSSGRPLRGICVKAFDARAHSSGLGQTGRSGRYTITGLATGRYRLFFFPCVSGGPDVGPVSRTRLVTVVAPRVVTGVNIKLSQGGSVSGLVTRAEQKSPQGSVCVVLVPVNSDNGDGFAVTGKNGRYLAQDLAPGKYDAYFNDPFCRFTAAGLAPQWYNSQPVQAAATDITVRAGHTTTAINAALKPPGAIIGTVTNRAHTGVRGECVTAIPVAGPPDPFTGIPQPADIAVTTRGGRYALADLPGGRYKIKFTVGCGATSYATQWWKKATSPKSATAITVGFATISGIDAVLRH